MVFFRKDAEQPTPIATESGASSPTEKLGDEKHEVVMPTREVDAAEEQRLIRKLDRRIVPMMVSMTIASRYLDCTLTLTSSTGLDVLDEVSSCSRRTAVLSLSDKTCSVSWTECLSATLVCMEWKVNSEWRTTITCLQSPCCSSPTAYVVPYRRQATKLTPTAFRNALECSIEAHATCKMARRYHFCMGSGSNFLCFLQRQERLYCMSSPSRSI